jgi:hypothetical protein
MNRAFYTIVISMLFLTSGYSQIRTFQWSDSVDGEWNNGFDGKTRTSIDTRIVIIGNYLYKSKSDFTYHWKCIPEVTLFEYRNNSFQPITNPDVFTDGGKAFLDLANLRLKQNYKTTEGEVNECLEGTEGYQTWEQIGIEFEEKGIYPTYFKEPTSACGGFNFCDTLIPWERAKPMFRNSVEKTSNFCTPAGPKVNIREMESAQSNVLFQLDKGQFFEIISSGKNDTVNGKSGWWYKINFEGKAGYIFSFYTLCKE